MGEAGFRGEDAPLSDGDDGGGPTGGLRVGFNVGDGLGRIGGVPGGGVPGGGGGARRV